MAADAGDTMTADTMAGDTMAADTVAADAPAAAAKGPGDAQGDAKGDASGDGRDDLVTALYASLLERAPTEAERAQWARLPPLPAAEIVRRFVATPAFARHRGVKAFFPAGHYHSPVVDPATVGPYVDRVRRLGLGGLAGISVDLGAMLSLFATDAPRLAALDLPDAPAPHRRYFAQKSPFPPGDAASLFLMMSRHRPRRIVEIGSGSSTAAALDFAGDLGLDPFAMTAIEPYPQRLRAMLRPGDEATVTIRETPVQDVPAGEAVAGLEAGDILLVDSTHVLKTGSDVHHELFHLLPAVRPGVLVHVHDVPFPFEYADFWIAERNYSWNEAYALRAFLMFNDAFRIVWWSSLVKAELGARMGEACRHYAGNAGSSIWLQRVR
jgi:hypothetical protein